ncbi:MAG: class I SAM-dependent methyltransferase [Anaerovoracaceae bacterium]
MLTPRLMAIANEIEKGESVADIGTDHGYLPMYLQMEGISPKVIMTDVSKGSLKKARENCEEICPDTKFDLRLGNGLKVIKENEVDNVIIAGMGGVLITEIIGKDLKKAKNLKKLIMQPRTAQGRLRYWLIKKGFIITNEQLVREGRFICEIITAVPGEAEESMRIDAGPDSIKWEMPIWLAKSNDPLVREFIDSKIEREKRILTSMGNSKNIGKEDVAAIENNIKYLESL